METHIYFGNQIYDKLKQHLDSENYSHIFVLTDSNSHLKCLPVFIDKCRLKYNFESIKIPAGEEQKTISTCVDVWKQLCMAKADRKSLIINLGGGVITDLGGFVASTFKRGVNYINIPTTLLAMVDAAIGGKTGVDLEGIKNQIGVINFPTTTLIDTDYLNTLPPRQKLSGISEILKHGLISSVNTWNGLISKNLMEEVDLLPIIESSSTIKLKIVEQDIREKKLRKTLNFGHTLGHAIETYFLNHKQKTALSHGEAISIGAIQAAYFSHHLTGLSKDALKIIVSEYMKYFEKIIFAPKDIKAIMTLLEHDKKNTHGNINFVLLKSIGHPIIDCKVPESLISESFDFYSKNA